MGSNRQKNNNKKRKLGSSFCFTEDDASESGNEGEREAWVSPVLVCECMYGKREREMDQRGREEGRKAREKKNIEGEIKQTEEWR